MPEQPRVSNQGGHVSQQLDAGRDVVAPGPGAPVAPGLLPPDVPGFTGREEELSTLAGLAEGGQRAVTAIGGTAGVGKTALAVQAAHRLLEHFPDGQLYADLRGYTEGQVPAEPDEVLALFLRSLGVPADEVPVLTRKRSARLRHLLASRRVLMVLDNARSGAQVRPLLPDAGESLVLVTSRSALADLDADADVSLDVLPDDEAAAMLTGVIGADRSDADPGAVTKLAGLCGGLPLALRIAGQVLAARHPDWPVARLAEMLAAERDRLERLDAADLQVRAVLEVSYGLLAEGDARLFRLLGLHPGPDVTAAAAAALAGIAVQDSAPALGRLAQACLVHEDATGRFSLHDLVRLFARQRSKEVDGESDSEAAEARLVGYYAELAASLNSGRDPHERPAAAEAAEQAGTPLPSTRETLAVFEAERRCLLAAVGLAAQRGWDEQVARVWEHAGESLRVLRHLEDLLALAEIAVAAARHARNSPALGRALMNLGEAYRELRRLEDAINCYREAFAIFREAGNNDREGLTLAPPGNDYIQSRRFAEAVPGLQLALMILRESSDRYGEGQILKNLGMTYVELQRFAEGIASLRGALAISRELGDLHGMGEILSSLGIAYLQLRRFNEGVACCEESLAMFREAEDRPGQGRALTILGDAYRSTRQLKRAVGYWQEAVAAVRDAGDLEQPERIEPEGAKIEARRRWFRRASADTGVQ